ncbi:Lrp/AsnC family transcriptional regulator [Candidatus Woesearchaeota archaeon]|nr:Lrp/AsnC family transcriptional regulator [Candidatus Woesearchaeota archaeon]
MDQKDWQIVRILQEHGDYTTRQIARRTLIPSTTINNRIRRMKKEGIIKKYTIVLDNRKIGIGFLAYILISVDLAFLKQKKKTEIEIAEDIRRLPFVERVDVVTGTTDLIALIRARDVEEFNHAILKKISTLDGIKQTQSMIVLDEK